MLNLCVAGGGGGGGGGVGFCDFKAHLADISSGSARAVQFMLGYPYDHIIISGNISGQYCTVFAKL